MRCDKTQYGETWTYEPGEMTEANRHIVEKQRQQQDYALALAARFIVGFVTCFVTGMATILIYRAMGS